MRCPYCGTPSTSVLDTRESDGGDIIRRRRRCLACDKRFTTYERVELKLPTVVKRDGRRAEFDRNKLASSMALALRKRPITTEMVDAAITRIEARLLASGEREVLSETLGEWVMDELRQLDKVAYVRYASVYRNFEDVDAFAQAIKEAKKPPPRRRKGTDADDLQEPLFK